MAIPAFWSVFGRWPAVIFFPAMLASLEEFRMYRVTVLATFTSEFGLTNPTAESSSTDFETLSAGKFAILVSEHPM